MAPPCPSRRYAAEYAVRFRHGVAKMAAAVSANSSAVLWVRVHFDERTIAWRGRHRRGGSSGGVTDNSALLVSHDITYGPRSGDVTAAAWDRALSAVIATLRGPRRLHGDIPLISPFADRPASPCHNSHAWYRIHPCEHHVRTSPVPRTRGLRKRAGWGSMSAPLDVILTDSGCHLFPMTSLTTMTPAVPAASRGAAATKFHSSRSRPY